MAPRDLGTKAVTLLPAAPVQTGVFAALMRRAIVTTTTLTTSQNPSHPGHPVTFTATVTATGVILPTGNVAFRNNGVDIGTAPLEGVAQATFTTSALGEGNHNITAFYQGNVSFDASTSPVLIHQIIAKKKEAHDEGKEEEETPVVHDDDNDDDLDRICRRFKDEHGDGDGGSGEWRDEKWAKLRRQCDEHWHNREKDQVVLIDKGIRRHIYGHYDAGGGRREYWDSRKQRWVPEHRYHKPHQKKFRHYHKPVKRHFAVTG